jgi:hypothetical protein
MTLYSIALFLHVVGALLLFASLTLEGIALRQMRRAAIPGEAQGARAILRLNRIIGPASLVGVLVPGLYMMATTWGWVAWIVVALAAYVLIAVFGAVNGIRILALESKLAAESVPPSQALGDRLVDPRFVAFWCGRVGIATGVVFLMTVKPGVVVAVLAVVFGAALGVALSASFWTRGPAAMPAGRDN